MPSYAMLQKLISFSFTTALFLFSLNASAFTLPRGMDSDDRKVTMQILGFGTATKFSSNPFPLGGWSGVEVSVNQEMVPVEKLKDLGANPGSHGNLSYTQISLGKGFYQDFDGFFSFTLPRQQSEAQNYSGLLRWAFYDLDAKRYLATATVHGQGLNVANLFTSESFGYDLILSRIDSWWSVYVGAGWVQVKTRFIGNPANVNEGLTSSGQTVIESEEHARTFLGIQGQYQNYFAVAEVQRVYENAYSFKLGYRY